MYSMQTNIPSAVADVYALAKVISIFIPLAAILEKFPLPPQEERLDIDVRCLKAKVISKAKGEVLLNLALCPHTLHVVVEFNEPWLTNGIISFVPEETTG